MRYRDRTGKEITGNEKQECILRVLYGTAPGRLLVKLLVHPVVSTIAGCFLNTKLSSFLAKAAVKKYGIDLSDYEERKFTSYNAFFRRKMIPGKRPVSAGKEILISPCDAKLLSIPVREGIRFHIKHSVYTLRSLLRNQKLAEKYEGGMLLVFRLTVDDYHHYCYIADGRKSKNVHIKGVFHSVNPFAADEIPVYKENTREYSVLETAEFGTVLMMEVGAMLVGKICNMHGAASVYQGEEKGYFEFGGSTVILGFEKDRICLDADIIRNSREQVETLVRMGERIGTAAHARETEMLVH